MIHTIVLAALLYAIVRAALRGRQPDPMAGRLVARSTFIPTQHQRDVVDEIMERERKQPAKVAAPIDYLAAYRPAWYAESLKIKPQS